MDTETDRPARHPADPAAGRRGRRRCATSATWRRSSASSSGSAATGCSAPTSTPTTATPTATSFHLVQGGLGLPDESYYRDEKFAEIREAYVAYLDHAARDSAATTSDPEAAARTVLDDRHPAGRRATGSAPRPATSRRPTTSRPSPSSRELCPAFDWDVYVTNLGASAHEADELLAETCVRQPSYFEHLSTVLGEVADRGLADLAAHPGAALRGAVPHRRLRRGQLRLLRPHPQRHPGAAGPLEARRQPGRGRDRRGGRQGVRRAALPAVAPSSRWTSWSRTCSRPTACRSAQLDWMTEETKARAYDKLDTFRPKIGYPEKFRDYSALRVRPDDLLGNVAGAAALRDRPPARQDRLARSTATSGSCCRRPSTPTTTPAPTRSASRPGSCRSRSSAPTPSRPRTTAASARSSATRSATASTTRARSTTAPATSTTGGRPTTRRRSR